MAIEESVGSGEFYGFVTLPWCQRALVYKSKARKEGKGKKNNQNLESSNNSKRQANAFEKYH